jgi:PII-like signaling protein
MPGATIARWETPPGAASRSPSRASTCACRRGTGRRGPCSGWSLSLSEDLPVAIIIVDAEDRIRAFLPQLDELVTEGLVIIDPVEVIRYVGRERR